MAVALRKPVEEFPIHAEEFTIQKARAYHTAYNPGTVWGRVAQRFVDLVLYWRYKSPKSLEHALKNSGLAADPLWRFSIRRFLRCDNWPGMAFVVLASSDSSELTGKLGGEWRNRVVRLAREALGSTVDGRKPFALLVYADSGTGEPPNKLLAFISRDLDGVRDKALDAIARASKASKFGIEIRFDKPELWEEIHVSTIRQTEKVTQSDQVASTSPDDLNPALKTTGLNFEWALAGAGFSGVNEVGTRHGREAVGTFGKWIETRFGGRYPGWLNLVALLVCCGLAASVALTLARNPYGAAAYLILLPLFILLGIIGANAQRD